MAKSVKNTIVAPVAIPAPNSQGEAPALANALTFDGVMSEALSLGMQARLGIDSTFDLAKLVYDATRQGVLERTKVRSVWFEYQRNANMARGVKPVDLNNSASVDTQVGKLVQYSKLAAIPGAAYSVIERTLDAMKDHGLPGSRQSACNKVLASVLKVGKHEPFTTKAIVELISPAEKAAQTALTEIAGIVKKAEKAKTDYPHAALSFEQVRALASQLEGQMMKAAIVAAGATEKPESEKTDAATGLRILQAAE